MTDDVLRPGWYPDPEDPIARRYWDGSAWSAPLRQEEERPSEPLGLAGPASGSRKWSRLIFAAALALCLGAAALYWFALRTTTMTVRGTLDIEGSRYSGSYTVGAPDSAGNTSCEGSEGYSDISQGVAVKITGPDGATVGTGALEEGIYIDGTDACIFGWQVTVPDDLDTYGVTVSHRGTLQFSKSEMDAGPDLSLGNS